MKRTTDQNRKMTLAPEKACAHCGKVFPRDPRNTWAYWEKAKYCGKVCFGLAHKLHAEHKRKPRAECFSKWVVQSGECWTWTGGKDKDGYGAFNYAGKSYRAPKIALELDGRPVPKGMFACHHCDNPVCVKPSHLYVGTPQENVDDMMRRGRANFAKKAS